MPGEQPMALVPISTTDDDARVGAQRVAPVILAPHQGLLLVRGHHGSLMLIEATPRFLSVDEIGQLGRRVR
jgi:hypothetical protein